MKPQGSTPTEEVFLYFISILYAFSLLFQVNISSEDMDPLGENDTIVHLPSPVLPEKSDISNMTIIRTGNGSIIEDQMFLNTVTAQVLSGVFVWSALLITCHQVSSPLQLKSESSDCVA